MGLEDWAKQQQTQIANQQRESLARQEEQQRQQVIGRMGGHGNPSNPGFTAGSRERANSQANAAAFDRGISQAVTHFNEISFNQPRSAANPTDDSDYVGARVPASIGYQGGSGTYRSGSAYSVFSPERYLLRENLGGAIRVGRNLKYSRSAKVLGCILVPGVGLAVYSFNRIRHTQLETGVLAIVLIVIGWFLLRIVGALFAGTLTAVGYLIAYTARALVAVTVVGAVVGAGILVLGAKNQKRPAATLQAAPLGVVAPTSQKPHHKTKHHGQMSSVASANNSGVAKKSSSWDSVESLKPRH